MPSAMLNISITLIGECNIEVASLFERKSALIICIYMLYSFGIAFRFGNLMNTVEGFNPASGHGGHVKHCYFF